MPTDDLIARTGECPITALRIADDLRKLGLASGTTVIVHCSLSALGWVVGGEQAVIDALSDVVGPTGTLVMPTHSPDWSDPADWQHPPVPERWWPVIREHWPAFDPARTPSQSMGAVAEAFRTMPGVLRSTHPQVSLAARGPRAEWLTRDHPLPFGTGWASPYAKLYEDDAYALLLGVGYNRCTTLHLAEYRIGSPRIPLYTESMAVNLDGRRSWTSVDDLDTDDSRFLAIGECLEGETPHVSAGRVGLASSRLFPIRPAVDFATGWLDAKLDAEAP
ncbi:MAG: AAC(3) family N-acetyltransferase [Planctomycetota bacterium]